MGAPRGGAILRSRSRDGSASWPAGLASGRRRGGGRRALGRRACACTTRRCERDASGQRPAGIIPLNGGAPERRAALRSLLCPAEWDGAAAGAEDVVQPRDSLAPRDEREGGTCVRLCVRVFPKSCAAAPLQTARCGGRSRAGGGQLRARGRSPLHRHHSRLLPEPRLPPCQRPAARPAGLPPCLPACHRLPACLPACLCVRACVRVPYNNSTFAQTLCAKLRRSRKRVREWENNFAPAASLSAARRRQRQSAWLWCCAGERTSVRLALEYKSPAHCL